MPLLKKFKNLINREKPEVHVPETDIPVIYLKPRMFPIPGLCF
jgi:hypothetical protein